MYDDQRPRFLRRADAVAAWALDAIVAVIALPLTLLAFTHGLRPRTHLAVIEAVGATGLSVLPLLVRRRWPVQVLAFILVVGAVYPGPSVFTVTALIALYTIASRRSRRATAAGAAATFASFVLHRLAWGYQLPLLAVVSELALTGLAVAAGLYQATRLAYFDQLRDRARRLERERELLLEQSAAEERMRIARELHDVVAHNVSLMVVQAQALQATAGRDPAAAEAARSIAQLGRDAMSEMHRTLQLIRPSGAEAERAPLPTLEGLGRLVAQARTAGLPVELRVEGKPRALEPALELSAYRIVQEALTNVVKHAGGAPTEVTVRFAPHALELDIVDHGPAGDHAPASETEAAARPETTANGAAPIDGSGHGLVGMHERVALFGGRLEAGARPAGGYRVTATLPTEGLR